MSFHQLLSLLQSAYLVRKTNPWSQVTVLPYLNTTLSKITKYTAIWTTVLRITAGETEMMDGSLCDRNEERALSRKLERYLQDLGGQ